MAVGVSLKTYFGRREARTWFDQVSERVRDHEAIRSGRVSLFVIPTYLQIDDALRSFADTGVAIGAQDVSAFPVGAYTGEVTAGELAESGVLYAEIGHAERRRLFGETEEVIADKVTATLNAGLIPVLCLGESDRLSATDAAAATVEQLHAGLAGAPAGPIVLAYEPVWAIGADAPAPVAHIREVTRSLRAALENDTDRAGSSVIYGGSAGPGLLTELGDAVDGLFLGRFAHDPANLIAVLDEASTQAAQETARLYRGVDPSQARGQGAGQGA
jgi:triosephosphate isomerase